MPSPNPLANMSKAEPQPAPPLPVPSPVDSTPYYGLRSWLSQMYVASFIAGGTAGAVSRTVVSPLERLKILLQVQNVGRDDYKMSISKALGKMWREEGWRGMMAGNGTNCIRIVPYSAVQFTSYNFYKQVCEFSLLRKLRIKAIGRRRTMGNGGGGSSSSTYQSSESKHRRHRP